MSDCKIYPADTVDIYGKVWPTVGENIRNGLFGKLKEAKININGKNITSSDLKISNIDDYGFRINKKGVLVLINKVTTGTVYLRITYNPTYCNVISDTLLTSIKADISILYTE